MKGQDLPDGRRLVRRALFDGVQSAAFAADRKLAAGLEAGRRAARAVYTTGRAAVVVLGLVLGVLVITDRIAPVAAALLAVALLVTPDLLARLHRAWEARQDGALAGLLGRDAFFHHAGPWLAPIPARERLAKYLALLTAGEVALSGVLLTLEASDAGPLALVATTV
ncbi:hypothetical protein [Sinomonas atrocyanea]|jgi:hypothetical protein|uniref:hypothetical protein n=1 Tax=Sinomonas atrocyanea TaxID=37927 RepID=UPI002863C432|nr:hypothetical protein [Sinomonas atrocyanea]MDR6623120.1 putative membrane protein YphA (DoxX/SURF4 family) [Sinomonas atrocyanea]